ncbi:MAG TPA: DUF2480 family protein [candidate division Zixibacteria bacterium]|nr:DUF2480 family protein [candidate division Zixibacteria bacterium]
MNFTIIDINDMLDKGIFKEDAFIAQAEQIDWALYKDKKILIRGCLSSIIPPWAYMILTGKLAAIAQSIRFGNEHDHIIILRKKNS